MKIALNGARLGAGKLSFAQFVDLASRHGFDGVDFWLGGVKSLAEQTGNAESALDYLAEKNIGLAAFGLDVEWRKDDATFLAGLEHLQETAQFAQAIGATRCCTWILPATNDDPEAWKVQTAYRFREIGKIFADHGVRLGLEWVGPHHLRAGGENATGANNAVYTLETTLELIDRIGLSNIGLLVDSYHCYTTGVTGDTLATLTDAQIVHVHINDAPKGVGRAGAKDGNRLLPGEGEIDLADFLGGLRRAGYTGYIAPEILAPQDIADNPETAAEKVRASLKGVGL